MTDSKNLWKKCIEVSRKICERLRSYTILSFPLVPFIMVLAYIFGPRFHFSCYIAQHSTNYLNTLTTFSGLGAEDAAGSLCSVYYYPPPYNII